MACSSSSSCSACGNGACDLSLMYAPTYPTIYPALDCTDLIQGSIDAILALNNENGSTIAEIHTYLETNCGVAINIDDLTIQIESAFRKGIVLRVNALASPPNAYKVNAAMAVINPTNKKYLRPICAFYKRK